MVVVLPGPPPTYHWCGVGGAALLLRPLGVVRCDGVKLQPYTHTPACDSDNDGDGDDNDGGGDTDCVEIYHE